MDHDGFQAKSVQLYGRIVKGLVNRILLRTRPLSRDRLPLPFWPLITVNLFQSFILNICNKLHCSRFNFIRFLVNDSTHLCHEIYRLFSVLLIQLFEHEHKRIRDHVRNNIWRKNRRQGAKWQTMNGQSLRVLMDKYVRSLSQGS